MILKYGFLLDTCVISELIKPSPSSSVVRWVDDQDEEVFYNTDALKESSVALFDPWEEDSGEY